MSREALAPAAEERAHTVQFYQDERVLADVLARFIVEGLVASEPVVVIATPDHREAFCERLRARSVDVERACGTGQLLMLDAAETLARILDGDVPDRARFRAVVGAILRRVSRNNEEVLYRTRVVTGDRFEVLTKAPTKR